MSVIRHKYHTLTRTFFHFILTRKKRFVNPSERKKFAFYHKNVLIRGEKKRILSKNSHKKV